MEWAKQQENTLSTLVDLINRTQYEQAKKYVASMDDEFLDELGGLLQYAVDFLDGEKWDRKGSIPV